MRRCWKSWIATIPATWRIWSKCLRAVRRQSASVCASLRRCSWICTSISTSPPMKGISPDAGGNSGSLGCPEVWWGVSVQACLKRSYLLGPARSYSLSYKVCLKLAFGLFRLTTAGVSDLEVLGSPERRTPASELFHYCQYSLMSTLLCIIPVWGMLLCCLLVSVAIMPIVPWLLSPQQSLQLLDHTWPLGRGYSGGNNNKNFCAPVLLRWSQQI